MKTYCPSCGCEHEYTLNKPNYCSRCGKSMNVFSASTYIPQKNNYRVNDTEEELEGDSSGINSNELKEIIGRLRSSPGQGISVDIASETPGALHKVNMSLVGSEDKPLVKRIVSQRDMDKRSALKNLFNEETESNRTEE